MDASTWEDKISLIKVAYFMLNFLNLKSFPSYLFFVVASSLSMVCVMIPKFDPIFIITYLQKPFRAKHFLSKYIKYKKILLTVLRFNKLWLHPQTMDAQ